MKIIFKNVTVQNFMSFGDTTTLFSYEKGMHVVTGAVKPGGKRNGAGKSTILVDSIVFSIYGRTMRKVKKESIINETNGNKCLVTCEFDIGTMCYRIERGVKPGFLRVWENKDGDFSGEPIEMDSIKNTQNWIMEKVGISYEAFINMIVLNINHSTPLLEMDSKEKRPVIVDLMNLGVYGKMAEVAKKKHLDAKTELEIIKKDLQSKIENYNLSKEKRNSLLLESEKFEEDKQKTIKELEAALDIKKKKVKELKGQIDGKVKTDTIKELEAALDAKMKRVEELKQQVDGKIIIDSIKDLEANLDNKKKKASELKRQVDGEEKTSTIKDLEEALADKKKKAEDIKSQITSEDYDSILGKLKEKNDDILNKIDLLKSKIQDNERNIKDSQKFIDNIKGKSECPTCRNPTDNPITKKFVDEAKELIVDSTNKLEKYSNNLEDGKETLSRLSTKMDSVREEKSNQDKLKSSYNSTLASIEESRHRIEAEKDKIRSSYENALSSIEDSEHRIQSEKDKLKSSYESALASIQDSKDRIQAEVDGMKNSYEHELRSIQDSEDRIQAEKDRKLDIDNIISENEIKEKEKSIKLIKKDKDAVNKDFVYNKFLRSMLGDDGIGKYVVRKILPFLNKKVNDYLSVLGSDYTLVFDADLNEVLRSKNNKEREYASFSGGEKKRIDLSVLLAMMDVAKSQNSVDTNILILDEVLDTSMDADGVESFMWHLKDSFKQIYPDKCIYVITHRKEIGEEIFDSIINVVKENHFTTIH